MNLVVFLHLAAVDPLAEASPWRCEDCAAMAPSNLATEVNNRVTNSIKILEEKGLDPESCEKFLMLHSRFIIFYLILYYKHTMY